MNIQRNKIKTANITLSVLTAGPDNGPPVVLLHGFPERAESWLAEINFLTAHGYFVIVPDQRGYEESDKPRDLKAYTHDVLASDIIAVIDYLKKDRVYLITHDWGTSVGWFLLTYYGSRF